MNGCGRTILERYNYNECWKVYKKIKYNNNKKMKFSKKEYKVYRGIGFTVVNKFIYYT